MKKMMVAGGLAGFGLGTLGGVLTEGSSWPGILFRSSVAALVAGCLMRWWAGVFTRCLAQAHTERLAAQANAKPPATFSPPKR
jgi:hypothetical protein